MPLGAQYLLPDDVIREVYPRGAHEVANASRAAANAVLSWKTAAQSAPKLQLVLPSLEANTYTKPLPESTIGPSTIPTPKSNWLEATTAPLAASTRYRKPPTSPTNTLLVTWS